MLAAGCIFSPDKGGGDPPKKDPVVYPVRNTPENALHYLEKAWSSRDSVRIDSLYASDYEGTSQDLADVNNPVTVTYYKSDEVRSVGGLALSNTISSIDMNFFSQYNWDKSHYVGDPADWVTFQIKDFTIYVNDSVRGENQAKSPTPGLTWFFEFTVRPAYPNGPTADPVWEIVRWKEVRDDTN